MKRFVEGADRRQSTLFPGRLEDWVGDDNPVRVVDVFVDELDLGALGFVWIEPRPSATPCRAPRPAPAGDAPDRCPSSAAPPRVTPRPRGRFA